MTISDSVPDVHLRTRFYIGMAALAALAVFFGFARTFYLGWMFDAPGLTPLVFAHGVASTAWFLLFLAQTWLVAARRTDTHRRLGIVGGLLTLLMIVLGCIAAIGAAKRGATPSPDMAPLTFLIVPLGTLFVFATFVGTALYFRRQPETHKRLMLLATISLLPPAVGRWPIVAANAWIGAPIVLAFIVACVAMDFFWRRRVHPALVWGGLWFVISWPLRIAVAGTDAWQAFAAWVTA